MATACETLPMEPSDEEPAQLGPVNVLLSTMVYKSYPETAFESPSCVGLVQDAAKPEEWHLVEVLNSEHPEDGCDAIVYTRDDIEWGNVPNPTKQRLLQATELAESAGQLRGEPGAQAAIADLLPALDELTDRNPPPGQVDPNGVLDMDGED